PRIVARRPRRVGARTRRMARPAGAAPSRDAARHARRAARRPGVRGERRRLGVRGAHRRHAARRANAAAARALPVLRDDPARSRQAIRGRAAQVPRPRDARDTRSPGRGRLPRVRARRRGARRTRARADRRGALGPRGGGRAMRIHRIEMEGFGPFRTLQTVDLDRFASDGLFLISGRTGTGKSSILDAVCFALYGSTPRYDGAEQRFRSDHAEPGEPTRVAVEFSVDDTRWRVERTPEYARPKRRGEGMTTEAP